MNPELIDTRIGTKSVPNLSHGNTLPLTGVPFGMNYLAVQTTHEDTSWWFHPEAHTFAGLRLTHQPSPWIGDFQHFALMPMAVTPASTASGAVLGYFRPEEAQMHPHRISLIDRTEKIEIEATNGMFGGAVRMTSLSNAGLRLRVLAPERSAVVAQKPLTLTFNNYADVEDKDFTMWVVLDLPEGAATAPLGPIDPEMGLDLDLGTKAATVRFATSFINAKQAALNLSRQPATFDQQVAETKTEWLKQLDQVEIEDRHQDRVATFYHNFYRASLFPTRFYETDEAGQDVHYSTFKKQVLPGKLFTNNGFWDTYKTSFPLYSLLMPERYHAFLEGFLNSYRETGFLPRWLSPDERGMMPGTMLDAIIADAAVKHLADDLLPEFLEAMIHGAETISDDPKYGREGLAEYLELGYVPATIGESVNKTLDYAYSDWLISVVATTLNQPEIAAKYEARSHNWQNVFDADLKLMHPRNADGSFTDNFVTTTWGEGFTEGSAWQNSFAVYQDIPGLIEKSGGREAFVAHLHELANQDPEFQIGSYWSTIHEMREMAAMDFGQIAMSNQPSFHIPYLYALAGDSAATQLVVKNLLMHTFTAKPDGYPGDEDNGSMASWYLWSALGLYPVTPGSGEYVLGIPLFDKVTVHLPNGKDLRLTATNNYDHMQFVGPRSFNGEALGTTISHAKLIEGGTLSARLQLLP